MKERGTKNKLYPVPVQFCPRQLLWALLGLQSRGCRAGGAAEPGLVSCQACTKGKDSLAEDRSLLRAQLQLRVEAKEMCLRGWHARNRCGKDREAWGLQEQHGRAGVNVTQQQNKGAFPSPCLGRLLLASPSICRAINPQLWRIFPAKPACAGHWNVNCTCCEELLNGSSR